MGPVDVSHSADLETEVQICPNGLLKLEIPFCPFSQHMSAQVFLCQIPVWSNSFLFCALWKYCCPPQTTLHHLEDLRNCVGMVSIYGARIRAQLQEKNNCLSVKWSDILWGWVPYKYLRTQRETQAALWSAVLLGPQPYAWVYSAASRGASITETGSVMQRQHRVLLVAWEVTRSCVFLNQGMAE